MYLPNRVLHFQVWESTVSNSLEIGSIGVQHQTVFRSELPFIEGSLEVMPIVEVDLAFAISDSLMQFSTKDERVVESLAVFSSHKLIARCRWPRQLTMSTFEELSLGLPEGRDLNLFEIDEVKLVWFGVYLWQLYHRYFGAAAAFTFRQNFSTHDKIIASD